MIRFLPQQDSLSQLINEKASDLYSRMERLPLDSLELSEFCLAYFRSSHLHRLHFSIETSAHLLYRSIKASSLAPSQVILMDYGAGVGSMYLLAKLVGCHVIYNDHLPDWKNCAVTIAQSLDIGIDEYVVGPIEPTLQKLTEKNLRCHIILTRNVIEHIYKLDEFYQVTARFQPNALIYSSTTANYYNPASWLKHVAWHRKCEKRYRPQREAIIREEFPLLKDDEIRHLGVRTRGLARHDITNAVAAYSQQRKEPQATSHSNTCDPESGVWAERLLTFREYRKLIPGHYDVEFVPGFWDTHYRNTLMNLMGKVLNGIISINQRAGFSLSPFIYVVAKPRSS